MFYLSLFLRLLLELYAYFEATDLHPRDIARIITPSFLSGTLEHNCLSFQYNAFGQHVGFLRVYGRVAGNMEYIWGMPNGQCYRYIHQVFYFFF